MGEVTLDNLFKESQANVWAAIRADATILGFTKNILDGVPQGLTNTIGFPYIIVPTPIVTSKKKTMTLRQKTLSFKVEIFTLKEEMTRTIAQRIASLFEGNEATFKTYGMMKFNCASAVLSYSTDADNKNVIYNVTMTLEWDWFG